MSGYKVILTQEGAASSGFMRLVSPETNKIGLEEFNLKINSILIQLNYIIDQQKRIADSIGASNLKKIYNNYLKTDSFTLEDLLEQLKEKINKNSPQDEKYSQSLKIIKGNVNNYRKAIMEANEILSQEIVINGDNLENIIQQHIQKLNNQEKQISKYQLEYYKSLLEMDQNTEEFKKYYQELKKLGHKLLSGKEFQIKLSDNNNKISVSNLSNVKDKNVGKAISDYLNLLLKKTNNIVDQQERGKFIKHSKYNRYKDKGIDKEAEAFKKARKALSSFLVAQEKTPSSSNVSKELNKIIDAVSTAIEKGKTSVTILDEKVINESSLQGFIMEYYTANMPSKKEIIENNITEEDIQIVATKNVGQLTRKVSVPISITDEKKKGTLKFINDSMSILTHPKEQMEQIENTVNNLKEFNEINEPNKIDNIMKLYNKNENSDQYIAFSHKFKHGLTLSNFVTIGSGGKSGLELNTTNLKSSLDLLQNSELDTNSLIFTLLNMSTASILRDESLEDKIKESIENYAASLFLQLSFNLSNSIDEIIKNNPDFSSISTNNTLCVFTTTNTCIEAYTILEQLKEKVVALQNVHNIVKAKIEFDKAHSSYPLWYAALDKYPSSKDKEARWNYVADQVAANTNLAIAFDTAALMSLLS